MCEYIRADCSLSEIKLMLDLLDNKCMNKQLQAYFLECPKITSDLKRFSKIEHEFNLIQEYNSLSDAQKLEKDRINAQTTQKDYERE